MRQVVLGLTFLMLCQPAEAQIGGLFQKLDQAKQKFDQVNVSEDEEIRIGQDVSANIRQRFGVVQDPAITRYVTLVGLMLARQSERPGLQWTFVVLDTDGVNAFAAPGGIVHITRGALGLIQNEAELAAVLGHEITHVAHKHALAAIRKNNLVQLGADKAADRSPLLREISTKAYDIILENAFDRSDELDADKGSVELAAQLGYAPAALASFLSRLDARNTDVPARNGLFASHPETRERIAEVDTLAAGRTGAMGQARYRSQVSYQPTPITEIATIVEGSSGLTGSTKTAGGADAQTDPQDPQQKKKKKGFGLGRLAAAVKPTNESAQVSASGGARGVGPDRAAKGGPDPSVVTVAVTEAEIAAFRQGIAG